MYGYGYHHDGLFGGLGMALLMVLLMMALLVVIVAAKYLFSTGPMRAARSSRKNICENASTY